MKRKFLALLLVGVMFGGTLAFAGCDSIAPWDGRGDQAENPGNQGENPGNQGENPADKGWSKDDDYHWKNEADKALHTVAGGVCTVCGEEVTHTVGLEYELVTPETKTVARTAASSLVDYENNGSYYAVMGIGSSTAEEIDLVIPATYNGIPVKEIGEKAFYHHGSGSGKLSVKSVVLPEGLEKIGDDAFCLTDLTALTIPSTVTSIGESAFFCTEIVSVVLPKTVVNLAHYSFGSPTVVYSEWSAEERKEIDDASNWYSNNAIYYYKEDFSQTSAGVHYWHYENGEIVEYTDWTGCSAIRVLAFYGLEGNIYWTVPIIDVEVTVTAAKGNDVEIEVRLIHYPASGDVVTKAVFDENGEYEYETYLGVWEVPAGYTGGSYPGENWKEEGHFANILIFEPEEITYTQGKIFVSMWAVIMPNDARIEAPPTCSIQVWIG